MKAAAKKGVTPKSGMKLALKSPGAKPVSASKLNLRTGKQNGSDKKKDLKRPRQEEQEEENVRDEEESNEEVNDEESSVASGSKDEREEQISSDEASEEQSEPEQEPELQVDTKKVPHDKSKNSKSNAGSDKPNASGDDDAESNVTFKDLGIDDALVQACKDLGWHKPTPIQAKAIPAALAGKDVIALAETGSGKTGAFALPILNRLLFDPKRLSALILAPTRELAVQIHEVFQALGNSIGASSVCILGGVDMVQQALMLAKRPHIVTATPGRLVDHLKHTKGFSMREVKTLVLDEADRMLSMDFEEEINTILSVISREGRNTMLFSATMTSKVQKLQRASLRPGDMTVRVQVSEKYGVVKNLDQRFMFVPAISRDKYLVWLLHEFSGKSAIVFTATCSHARRLAYLLKYLDLGGGIALHGQMAQSARLAALAKFKGQAGRILIATDVAARGLDIPSVDLVVNYDVPQSSKDYIHRVGRTARAGRAGKAVTIVSQYDVEAFQKIEQHLGEKLEPIKVDKSIIESLEETVAEASRRANADMREEEKSDTNQKKRRKYRA